MSHPWFTSTDMAEEASSIVLTLAPSVQIDYQSDGVLLTHYRQTLFLSDRNVQGREVIAQLLENGQSIDQLMVSAEGDTIACARIHYTITALDNIAAIERTLMVREVCAARLHPHSGFSPISPVVDGDSCYRLSRFASLQSERQQDGFHWVLNSPLGHAGLTIYGQVCRSVLMDLVDAHTPAELAERNALPQTTVMLLLQLVLWCGSAGPIDDEGTLAEERSAALRHWEPHDLQFHSRSRLGRNSGAYGGTFHFQSEEQELPAIPPFVRHNCIALPRPDLEYVAQSESSLCEIMEARCSDRNFGNSPLTPEQIGALLFRSARLKEVRRKNGSEIAYYPYPGGGARSELAIYPVLSEGQGYPAGLYRYEASTHSLLSIQEMTPEVAQLLRDAQVTLNAASAPPLLLIFAARFRRVSYKYEAMAYSVMLKNVGALMQTLYLNATAMQLAACALGGGDADLFARCIGNDYYEETSIGEFVVGTRNSN